MTMHAARDLGPEKGDWLNATRRKTSVPLDLLWMHPVHLALDPKGCAGLLLVSPASGVRASDREDRPRLLKRFRGLCSSRAAQIRSTPPSHPLDARVASEKRREPMSCRCDRSLPHFGRASRVVHFHLN